MKKFISMLLVAAMALSLAACGGAASSTAASTAASSKAASSTAASSTAATGTTGKIALFVGDLGDNSFSDSANRGIEELKTKGWDATTIKTGPESNSDKYADIIQDAIDDGANYCVGSSSYHTMMVDLAKENKDVKLSSSTISRRTPMSSPTTTSSSSSTSRMRAPTSLACWLPA